MKFSLTLLLGLSLGAMAQVPTAPLPEAAVPGAPKAGEIKRGEKRNPNAVAVAKNDTLQKADITMQSAARIYEKFSGKRVIMTTKIAKSEISFAMKGPLTKAEASRFLQLTFLAEGVAICPIPEQPGIVRLIPSGPITGGGAVPKEPLKPEANPKTSGTK